MVTNNSTTNVIVSRSGTGWTVDVTACNLSSDTGVKDFIVFDDGTQMSLADFTKNSAVQITYNGVAIASSSITVQRKTPVTRVNEPAYRSVISVADYNTEFNRIHRILNEFNISGTGVTPPGGSTFTGVVTFNSATANFTSASSLNIQNLCTLNVQNGAVAAIQSGGQLNYLAGSTSTFAGTLDFLSGAVVDVQSGVDWDWETGSNVDFQSGSVTQFSSGSSLTFASSPTFSAGAALGTGTFSGNATFSGNVTFSGNPVTFNAAAGSVVFTNPPTLTNKPNQLTATGTEVVNADWVRQSIRPYVEVTTGSGQSVAHNTNSDILLGTEVSDLDSAFASNTFTCPTGAGGLYLATGLVNFSATCTAIFLGLNVNGNRTGYNANQSSADAASSCGFSTVVQLAAGDTVRLHVLQQNSGSANRTISSAELKIVKLGEIS